MLFRFFGDAFVVLHCPFWSTILLCSARLQLLDRAVSGVRFLTGEHCSLSVGGSTVYDVYDQV